MYPALVFAGTHGPNIAAWLLAHSAELGDAAARVARPVMAAITDPTASLDRIGAALVARQDGRTEVVGLLHQHTSQLDGIAAAVDGVGRSVGDVGQAVGLLTSLSMVGLGMAVLSQAHIAFQFARLTERLKRLEAEVQEVKEMLHAGLRGELDAGLIKLQAGLDLRATAPERAEDRFRRAVDNLTNSGAKYAELLRGGVGARSPQTRWVLARHLTVAVLGEAAGHTRLGEPAAAAAALERGLAPLREHARAVFARTVGARPDAFLMPALADHGIGLEAMAELYRQATHAGVLDGRARVTAAEVFESLRPGLGGGMTGPRFFRAGKVERLRTDFAEAAAAVEEVNRLAGLALAVRHCAGNGQDYPALAERIVAEVASRRPADGTCFAVFPPAAG